MMARTVVALVLALTLAGCELVFPPTPGPDGLLQRELQAARATWVEQAVDDYRYTVRFGCFCPDTITGPFLVTVVDGAMTDIRRVDGRPLGDPGRFMVPLTIDEVFERAADALEADELTLVYDPRWGFPTEIVVNPSLGAVDEEYSITITDFIVTS